MEHSGNFRLTAYAKGKLVLPLLLRRGLGLVPGDLLCLEDSGTAVGIQIYREIFARRWEFVPRETRWMNVEMFLSETLAAMDEHGALVMPEEVLEVRKGETYALVAFRCSDRHVLFLEREPLNVN